MSVSEPLGLALMAWLASAAFNSILAAVVHRRLRTGEAALDLAVFLFLFIFTTTGVNMAAGLAGILAWQVLGALSGGALAVALILPSTRHEVVESIAGLRVLAAGLSAVWRRLQPWLRALTIGFAAASIVRFSFLILVLPPFVWDSLTYHLTNVAHWTQAARIELFETSMHRIFTPANFEVLTTWFTVFLQHDVVVEAAGLPAYALAMAAVFALSRQLGMGRPFAWIAAMSYGVAPGILIAVTGTKNDPHMAAYYLLAMALIAFIASSVDRSSDRQLAAGTVTLTLVLLLAAGTKAYIAHLIPGLLLFGLALALIEGGPQAIVRGLKGGLRGLTGAGQGRLAVYVLVLAVGAFLGGYWNIRNWILMGNPFYPYGVAIEGDLVLEGADRTAALTVDRLRENLRLLVERFGDHKEPIRPDLVYVTGWGWVSYVIGLPAAVWASVSVRRYRGVLLGFAGSFLLILLSIRPTPWNLRYTIWVPAVFAIAVGFWFERLTSASLWVQRGFGALLVLSMGLNIATTLNYNKVSVEQFQQMLEQSPWSRGAANLRLTVPSEYEHALVFTPRDEVLGYNTHSNGFIYPLFRPDYSQRIAYVPFTPEDSCAQIADEMQIRGTRYLAVAPEHTPDRNILRLRQCAEQGDIIRERSRGLYILEQN